MRTILSCKFNIDTTCVELRMEDEALLSIGCTVIDNEGVHSMYQQSELD